MKKEEFPTKIYTFKGDEGYTKTLDGHSVSKDDCLMEVHGDIDSLQAMLDKLIAYAKYSDIMAQQKPLFLRIQTLLWQMGGELSQKKVGGYVNQPLEESDIVDMERIIDSFKLNLDSFQRFTNLIAIDVNETRVRTRKLERTMTNYLKKQIIRPVVFKYTNRLSDYFFALAVKVQKEDKDF